MAKFVCPYCPEDEFIAPSWTLLLTHIRLVHSLDPNVSIQCSIDGCSRTFTNFRTYQNHQRTYHSIITNSSDQSVSDHDNQEFWNTDSNLEMYTSSLETAVDMRSFSARWILKTSETRSLTWRATLGIVADVSDMVDFVVESLRTQTNSVLSNAGVDLLSKVNEVFNSSNTRPFEGLTSFHHQLQYYKDYFNFIVSHIM